MQVHQGISIENASYIENNLEVENKLDNLTNDEEHTPKLFSEENNYRVENEDIQNEVLFDQSSSDEEEFEIPAFLRKAKILMLILIDNETTPKSLEGKNTFR